MSDAGPILVTGADRSGTTLLYALLASHSDISMARRTNLWRWFYGSYGDLSDPVNLDRCLAMMMRYPRLNVLELDPEEIREAFALRDPTYGQLFSVMQEQQAARRGRSRWGDKSLHTEHHSHEIFSELPEARILHMVRDPRDRYASIVRRYDDRGKGVGAAMGRWLASVRAGRRNVQRFGDDRYRMVRYETLASSPEITMSSICDFIGVPYEPAMLEMRGVEDAADDAGNSSFEPIGSGEISTRSIGRFRATLSPRTIASVQVLSGRWMAVHDYPTEPIALSPADRVHLWSGDLPVQAVRTAGWLLDDRVKRWRTRDIPTHRLSPASNGVVGS